jgi:hypothetical protein
MRNRWLSLVVNASVLVIVLIGPLLVVAVPAVDLTLCQEHPHAQSISSGDFRVLRRDGDHVHMHHGAPLTELNETEILQWHAPTPPSYWSIDIDDRDPSVLRYPGFMALHMVFMTLAFFVALPVGKLIGALYALGLTVFRCTGIAMRAVNHSLHGVAAVAFYSLCVLGCASGALYMKLTPDM